MKKNTLFGLMKYCQKMNGKFLSDNQVEAVLSKNIIGRQYFRIELPVQKSLLTHELTDAHLSVYQNFDPENPTLSAAHFTAFFNVAEERYRLHIYLDENEVLLGEPHWHLENESNHFIKKELPQEIEILMLDIFNIGLPIIQQLRQLKEKAETQLNQKYENKELECAKRLQELLAAKESIDNATYIQSLNELIGIVKQLNSISSDSRWPRLTNLLEARRKKVEQFRSPLPIHESVNTDLNCDEKTSTVAKSNVTQRKTKKIKVEKKLVINETKTSLFVKFIKNYQHYLNLNDKVKAVSLLISLFAQLDKLIDDDNLTVKQYQKLVDAEKELVTQAVKIANRCFITGELSIVKALHHYIESDYFSKINYALQMGNFDIVEFLVRDMGFPLLTYPISVGKIQYTNLMHYIFENAKKTPQLVALFAIFIENKVNLMASLKPGGLPLAHLILSQEPEHPLLSVLNNQGVMNNKNLYQQLIIACNKYLSNNSLSIEEKESLNQAVLKYKARLALVEHNRVIILPKNILAQTERLEQIVRSKLNKDFRSQMESDPEIIQSFTQLVNLNAEVIKKYKAICILKNGKRPAIANEALREFSTINKALSQCDLDIAMNFYDEKDAILEQFQQLINYLADNLNSLNLQEQILNTPNTRRNTREYKRLCEKVKQYTTALTKQSKELKQNKIVSSAEIIEPKKTISTFINTLEEYCNNLRLIENIQNDLIKTLEQEINQTLEQTDDKTASNSCSSSSSSDELARRQNNKVEKVEGILEKLSFLCGESSGNSRSSSSNACDDETIETQDSSIKKSKP